MPKELSQTRKTAAKVLVAALKLIKENGGSMRGSDMIEHLSKTIAFTEWESATYESTGNPKWVTVLQFYSIDAAKAGFVQKSKGNWSITPEGEEAIKLPPDDFIEMIVKKYREWRSQQPQVEKIGTTSPTEELSVDKDISFEQQQQALLEQFEEKAYDGLKQYVLNKNPYEFQDMVAALLASMGYYISHIAKKGRDGGIDIIMYTDPLGTKPPRIIVQVKHRPDTSVPSDDIQRLVGTMKRDSDVGIFVTSGDFSNPARQEARMSGKHVELIDFDRFIELWQSHYHKMSDDQKNMLPLHPIYFLGVNE